MAIKIDSFTLICFDERFSGSIVRPLQSSDKHTYVFIR